MANHKILKPTGIFDTDNGTKLRQEITNSIAEGFETILIDFTDVSFMNSSGLGALVASYKTVKTAKANLSLCNLNDQLKIIFELTKMDQIFKIFDNPEEFFKNINN
ncbi:STAS domain-containing protein [Geminocystis sp. GBBB08]|uniref:STAS domain-containing protein n=1 Tax=Geminocystis sp. GBBB08 TaxID=2604140 RepID=UPI0027E2DC8D|nr:STAS domain-containing protein [Geminocystis sp. GBBB08]MBL1210869.1 STAS domain-containing protein [Geminocystis sp. GBBB08]